MDTRFTNKFMYLSIYYAIVELQGGPKKWGHRLMDTILSNPNRLKNFPLEYFWVNL